MARIWSGMHGIFHFQYPSASPVRHPPAGEAGRYPARAAARAAALRSWALGTFTIITGADARDRNSILLLILLVSKTCQNAQANPPRRTAADRYCLRATAKGGELVLQTICQLHVTNFEFGAAAAVESTLPIRIDRRDIMVRTRLGARRARLADRLLPCVLVDAFVPNYPSHPALSPGLRFRSTCRAPCCFSLHPRWRTSLSRTRRR